jgi:hypothetical protein
MTIFRLVGGTDVQPSAAPTTPRDAPASCQTSFRMIDDRHSTETLSTTAKNGRLREKRKEIWRMAEAATRYWRLRLDFDSAVEHAQRMEIPEGRYHPIADFKDRPSMVRLFREALVKQLFTPAPDGASVKWKQAALAGRQYRHTAVKPERIERAIADDLAFLAAHPVRQSKRRSGEGQRCNAGAQRRGAAMTNIVEFPVAEKSITEDEIDKLHSEAFRDLESGISDCAIMASIAVQMAERAIEGRDDKHEKAMFAVFQVAVMLKKLKADYYAAWHGERQP